MSDIVDRAQAAEEIYRDAALAQRKRRPGAAPAPECCIDCGGEIPPARRAAAPEARRCIECQERHERR